MGRHPLFSLVADQIRQVLGTPDYWHLDAPDGKYVDLSTPRGYYFDYSARGDYRGRTDSDGVPVHSLEHGRPVYCPPDVAQFAFGNLERYLETGSRLRRERFEAAAMRLMHEAEEIPGSFVAWPMPLAPRGFSRMLGRGWFSAMAQGECISVLVRASSLVRLDGALDLAARALGAFRVTVEEGGMLREIGDPGQNGGLESVAFLEEYPMADRPSMVLNGHIHAMWGIYDYMKVTADQGAVALFDRCRRGLKFVIDRYDLGYWTRYDLDDGWRGINPASRHYHQIHVRQLRTLHRMTGDEDLLEHSRRWERYLASARNARKAYWQKVRFKLLNLDSVVG